ncbi:MAG: TMEM165/GDT1 family protein [Haloferacaceae archaeon]
MAAAFAAAGLTSVIRRYDAYGPLLASFLANLLATFGDKGQLVVVTLASRYDAERVFAGAVAAFALWSAVEVLVGQWVVRVLPPGLIALLTGLLFVAFGLWTHRAAYRKFSRGDGACPEGGSSTGDLLTGGGLDVGLSGKVLPEGVLTRVGAYGGVLTSFVFIMFAEFGDKTQLLTINLAATFPDAPLSVFVGVVAALALRTGVDALVGERVERAVPTAWIELAAAAVFVAFGLTVLGLLPSAGLVGVLGVLVVMGAAAALWRFLG